MGHDDFDDLVRKAEAEGLWIRSDYAGRDFTPSELLAEQAKGNFRWWNVENWDLIHPDTIIAGYRDKIEELEQRILGIRSRVEREHQCTSAG